MPDDQQVGDYPRCVWQEGGDLAGLHPCKVRRGYAFTHTHTHKLREKTEMRNHTGWLEDHDTYN